MSKAKTHNNADFFIDQSTLTEQDLRDGSLVMLNSGNVLRKEHYMPSKKTPLHDAAKKGDITAFVEILHADDDVNLLETDSAGDNLLHCAAQGGSEWIAYIILERCTITQKTLLINEKGFSGMTPLDWAALSGNEKIVKWFLDAGSDVTITDDEGNTALHFGATESSNVDIVKFLVLGYSDAELVSIMLQSSKYDGTVFDIAKSEGGIEICKFLAPYAEMMGIEGFNVADDVA